MKKYLFLLLLICPAALLKAQTDTVNSKIRKIAYKHVDAVATFPQGDFKTYITRSLQTDHTVEYSVKGQIILLMNIGADGNVATVTVLKSLSPQIDPEVVRVIRASPKWRPATLNGANVSMDMVLNIDLAVRGIKPAPTKPKVTKAPAAPVLAMAPPVTAPNPANGSVKKERIVPLKLTPPVAEKKLQSLTASKPISLVPKKANAVTAKKPAPTIAVKPAPVVVKKIAPPIIKKPAPVAAKKIGPPVKKGVLPVAKPDPVIAKKAVLPAKIPAPIAAKPIPVAAKKTVPPVVKPIPAIAKKTAEPVKKMTLHSVKKPAPMIAKKIEAAKKPANITLAKKPASAKQADPAPVVKKTKRTLAKMDLFHPTSNGAIFPGGGLPAFFKYLGENIGYPPASKMANIEGKVYLSFTIEDDGTLDEVEVISSPAEDLSQEAIRVLMASPKWKPASQNGIKVAVSYTIPIKFTLENKTTN